MKKLLLFSLILNICFASASVILVHRKGGFEFIESKFRDTIAEKKPGFYFKNSSYWKESKSMYDILPVD